MSRPVRCVRHRPRNEIGEEEPGARGRRRLGPRVRPPFPSRGGNVPIKPLSLTKDGFGDL